MHAQTHMHTSHPRRHTHSIMSTWLCMVSVWRSPQRGCCCDSCLNQQDPALTDWLGKVQPSRSREWRCVLVYACKCVSLSVFVHVRDCSGCVCVCVCAGIICECVCMNVKMTGEKREKMREGIGNHVGWIRHFCFKNGGLEGLMKTLAWTKRNC